jgi:hypothetical protein
MDSVLDAYPNDADEKGPPDAPEELVCDEREEKDSPATRAFSSYLEGLNHILGRVPPELVRDFINEHMSDQVDSLVSSFKAEFDDAQDDDPVMIECLKVLGRLGITITRTLDDGDPAFSEPIDTPLQGHLGGR